MEPGLSVWHIIILLTLAVIFLVPIAKIVSRAGYSGWWCLIYFVPIVNIVMLWVFAFSNWPALGAKNSG